MLITNEYTILIATDAGKDVTLKPGIPFSPFSGNYKVSCYARIVDAKSGAHVVSLNPGETVTSVGKQPKEDLLDKKSVQELREICIEKSLTFPKKATKKELLCLITNK